MADKQVVKDHRTTDIYDTVVYIYDNSEGEGADGNDGLVVLAGEDFEKTRSNVLQLTTQSTKSAKDYVTKKFGGSSYLFSFMMMQRQVPRPAENKIRDVIINARTSADSMLHLAVQVLLKKNYKLEEGEKIALPSDKKIDFFDGKLVEWLDCLEKLPCFTSSANRREELMDLLGFTDATTRKQWVVITKRLADRFTTRSVYFLESDLREMHQVLPKGDLDQKAFAGHSEVRQLDDSETFCRFIIHISANIEKCEKLSTGY